MFQPDQGLDCGYFVDCFLLPLHELRDAVRVDLRQRDVEGRQHWVVGDPRQEDVVLG